MRYVTLYGAFLVQWLKVLMLDRTNFVVGALSMVFVQAAGLLTVWVVLRQAPTMGGWTFDEVLLVYGMLTLARGLNQAFATSLWDFGQEMVQNGSFDRFLVRPLDPLFHLLANRFNQEGVGNLAVGALLVTRAALALQIDWTLLKAAYLLIAVVSGGLILMALTLVTAVPAFWVRDSMALMWSYRNAEEFAMYPLSIFKKAVSVLFTWAIPIGFASFYPASYLTGRDVGVLAWISPLVAASLLFLAYRFWRFGLRHYTSTGS